MQKGHQAQRIPSSRTPSTSHKTHDRVVSFILVVWIRRLWFLSLLYKCEMRGKRRRQRERTPRRSVDDDPLASIRAVLDPVYPKIFTFQEFTTTFAPSLSLSAPCRRTTEYERLLRTIVVPSVSLTPAEHIQLVESREPVPSLVDDVVWLLVQRRERSRRQGLDGRNVLAQGYVLGSETKHPRSCPMMRPGVVCQHPNNNVSFCKTSSFFRQLHSLVGDEVLRMVLLNTRLFVPIEYDGRNENEAQGQGNNFMLVCGPPLRTSNATFTNPSSGAKRSISDTNGEGTKSATSAKVKPRKKRKRGRATIEPKLAANSVIPRYNLFYADSYIPKAGLPQGHCLNRPITWDRLLSSMVDIYNGNGVKRRKRWKRMRDTGKLVCEEIISRHRKCDYTRLLQRICPLPSFCDNRDDGPSQERKQITLAQLAASSTPSSKVVSFQAAILRKVFPETFWGCPHNFNQVVETIKAFVNLRRKEKLPNKRLLQGFRVTKMTWLFGGKKKPCSRTDHESATTLSLLVLRWLFRTFVIPILRSNFYVTESEFSSHRVLYYRKPVWSLFRCLSIRKLLQNQFTEITEDEARKRQSIQHLHFSRLRFLPKETGVRPIAHLSQKAVLRFTANAKGQSNVKRNIDDARIQEVSMKRRKLENVKGLAMGLEQGLSPNHSTNEILSDVFEVLRHEYKKKPLSYGTGLEGLAHFYPRYRRFMEKLRKHRTGSNSFELFFASVDIQKCYDTIHQGHLLDIARRFVSQQDYLIRRCNLLVPSREDGKLRRLVKKIVGPPESYNLFEEAKPDFVKQQVGAIVTDATKYSLATRDHILALLEEHIRDNLLFTTGRYKKRYFVQSMGISQGSILSMLLCNLYYGEIEKKLLSEGQFQNLWLMDHDDSDSLGLNFLARLVDDFILVTTNKAVLNLFLERMYQGKPELGTQINREKTMVNTTVKVVLNKEEPEQDPQIITVNDTTRLSACGQQFFPWCGMLFNTSTGEVLVDYTRFAAGTAVDSLTVDMAGGEGKRLVFRMKSFVRPRCMPILYDASINSLNVIVTNFYQMMLLGAVKTAEYLRNIATPSAQIGNTRFLLQGIESVSSYAIQIIKSNLRRTSSANGFILNRKAVAWLSWLAFRDVFARLSDFRSVTSQIVAQLATKSEHHSFRRVVDAAFENFKLDVLLESSHLKIISEVV